MSGQPPKRTVASPAPSKICNELQKVEEVELVDSDEEDAGAVGPAGCGGSEGGSLMESESSSDSSKESETSDEESEISDDEDSLCGSGDEGKGLTDEACNKFLEKFFLKMGKKKVNIRCHILDVSNDGCEVPKQKKPKISPFAVGLNGPVIIPDGAEPLDDSYEENLKMLEENKEVSKEGNFTMDPMKMQLIKKQPSNMETDCETDTENMEGEMEPMDITN